MGKLTWQKYGDWAKAGIVLQGIQDHLTPDFIVQFKDDSDFVLEKLQGHIDAQDLGWTPLAESTIRLKGGNSTILVETGYLRNNLKVRKVKSATNGVSFFIGADAWTSHPSGMQFSQLMIWLEYGTSKMPPRPLIRPTWEEVQDVLKEHWRELFSEICTTGGGVR